MTRVDKVFSVCDLQEHQAVLLSKPSNMFYVSGYTGEGLVFLSKAHRAIITDSRYTEQAERQAPGFSVHMIGRGVSHEAIAYGLMQEEGIDTLLYEDDQYTVRAFERMKKTMPGVTFLSLDNAPEKVRVIKEESEVKLIEQACDITCRAFEMLCREIRPGWTEKQAQIRLDHLMLECGADGLAFDTIVASGNNGSLPHAIPSDRVMQQGDMVTFDFGARKGGYDADVTRNICFGEPSAEMRRIYDTVLEAQCTCEAALAPGKTCKEIDLKAREIIDNAGYAGRFGHGLGHGVGIDIHEQPRLSYASDDVLTPGHIVTVEPGIYVPGLGGVRIENTCVIMEDGARTLVHASKELVIIK